MTTSYELSLKLKELGVEQHHGEYYWVQTWQGEERLIHRLQSQTAILNLDTKVRAFTLGELVRELFVLGGIEDIVISEYSTELKLFFVETNEPLKKCQSEISPEEAAGELLAAVKSQEKLKA